MLSSHFDLPLTILFSLEAVGTNRIFGHREDETIRLDPEVAKNLGKDSQRPDMVFGLRQTRNIENLMYDSIKFGLEDPTRARSVQVHELLPQPLNQTGDALLFPFLVLESKSGTSGTDWHSIHLQTAFAIRTFLQAQIRLQTAAAEGSRRPINPVVWFLCNKGEDWKLSLAMVEKSQSLESEVFACVSNSIPPKLVARYANFM